MIGTTIDQYRIEARLGGGGMGEVFRARDLELDRDVAIKLVRPELADLDEVTARFRAEARTLAGLAHTNIATVFRFFPHEGTLYLVMEYISGQPFGDMLRDKGARPPGEVVHMLKQALSGLGYAHDNKVVHRDIKPGNLMLDGHNTVKVLDFGIAHLLDQTRITQSGSVLGTPAYMAPEQVLGQQVDGRTDLYALGVVLFEMLTGKLPFKATSQFELMRAHLETEPRSLKEMTDTVPRALQNTIVRALAKDSGARYQSAAEFSGALDVALAEAQADGDDLSTAVAARRSPVAVSAGKKPAASSAEKTVARSDSAITDTEVRMPTSVEIPLPAPKTAAGFGVAAVLLAGAGIWWASSGGDSAPVRQASTSGGGANTQPIGSPTASNRQPEGTGGWFDDLDAQDTQQPGAGTTIIESASNAAQNSNAVPSSAVSPSTSGAGANVSSTQTLSTSEPAKVASAADTAKVQVQAQPKPVVQPTRTTSAPTVRRSTSNTTSSLSGYKVRATKVSAHERQGTGRLSRAAGYNGSFEFSAPRDAQPLQIDELIEVYEGNRQLSRQLIHSQSRKPGRFKSKQRIPGLKELGTGIYQLRLVFESEGRRLGQHEWTLAVSG